MWEVIGHWIVERVVVLPDDDSIRSPDKAEMEFRPLGVTIQFTEQLVAFRRWKLDNTAAINRHVDEQVPSAIPRIAGHQWMNDWRGVLHRFRFLFRIPALGILSCRHAMVAMQALDPFLQSIGKCVIRSRKAGEHGVTTDGRQYLRVKRKDAGRQFAELMVHVPEIDLLLFIGSGMDGADFRWMVSIHDHVFLHGRAEDPQKFRVLMWREVLIAKHKNFAVGQNLSEFPLRFQAWLSQVDPRNLGAQRGHDWTLIDMRERPGRDWSYRSKGFKSVMRALARYRGQARYRQYVGLCHS